MAKISFHFDGGIAQDHKISLRTLSRSHVHLQSAIDRAYLDVKYDGVWKGARLKTEDYSETDFICLRPENGGYITGFVSTLPYANRIIDRIRAALQPAVDRAIEDAELEAQNYENALDDRNAQINAGIIQPRDFNDVLLNPDETVIRAFGDRSIVKEIDQILTVIRAHPDDSELEITLDGANQYVCKFNKDSGSAFHRIITERGIGLPVIYRGQIRSLDAKYLSGKFINSDNKRTHNIFLHNRQNFQAIHPFLATRAEFTFIGCPAIEYGAFEPNSGDIHFLTLN